MRASRDDRGFGLFRPFLSTMIEPIELRDLAVSLGLGRGEMVSLVGGGGKTTTLFELGRQLPGNSLMTTTTKMGSEQDGGFPVLLAPTDDQIASAFRETSGVLVWRDRSERKAMGVSPEDCDKWFDLAAVDNVIVEADGSRQRPFKAPDDLEPVVPSRTTVLVACLGAEALGQTIADKCHRPDRVTAIARCSPDQHLTPERAAAVLLSDRGSRKSLPPEARYVVVVHGIDGASHSFVDELADLVSDAATLIAVCQNNEGRKPLSPAL